MVVCHNRKSGKVLLERVITGQTSVNFEPALLDPEGERCAQLRDIIPASTLQAGLFRYEVIAKQGDKVVAQAQRQFIAASRTAVEE